MYALILFDETTTDEDLLHSTMARILLNNGRVKLVSVNQVSARDFENITHCLLACRAPRFAAPVRSIYEARRAAGMVVFNANEPNFDMSQNTSTRFAMA